MTDIAKINVTLAAPTQLTVSMASNVLAAYASPATPVAVPGAATTTATVSVLTQRGPAGPQGIPGPTGAGAAGANLTFTQQVAATTWTITHNFGYNPSVTVIDSSGNVVIGNVSYPSVDQVIVTFTVQFSGTAYLI